MKTKRLNVDGDITLKGKFMISCETENDYIIGISKDFKPNFFQRFLYKILGFNIIKKQ